MRTEPFQLPSHQELVAILDSEAKWDIPEEKKNLHFTDFSTIVALLEYFEIDSWFFTKDFAFDDLADESLYKSVIDTFQTLAMKVGETSDNSLTQVLTNNLFDYLSEDDAPQKSDLIFVFGSSSTIRTETAIRLYREGYGPKILISGRGPFYREAVISEAEKLSKLAIDQDVPIEDLILEKEAISMPDNIKRSLRLLQSQHIPHKSILLVNSPFSQRRGWAHCMKMCPAGTRLLRINTDTVSPHLSRDGWYRDEIGCRTVLKEFYGLRISHLIHSA